jgi:hypothetical protein
MKLLTRTKIRQNSQDPQRTPGGFGFEIGVVTTINSSFSQLLRGVVRGGGRPHTTTLRDDPRPIATSTILTRVGSSITKLEEATDIKQKTV